MTDELIQKLIKIVESFTIFDGIVFITLLCMIPVMVFNIIHLIKMYQWRKEYLLTLTDEQLKLIKKYKELNK